MTEMRYDRVLAIPSFGCIPSFVEEATIPVLGGTRRVAIRNNVLVMISVYQSCARRFIEHLTPLLSLL